MGDYNVLIISAKVNLRPGMTKDRFELEVKSRLRLCDSAYHATSPFLSITQNFHESLNISMITQAKYNYGVDEFLDWLRPMVVRGLGQDEAWAINFNEFARLPDIEYLRIKNEEAV